MRDRTNLTRSRTTLQVACNLKVKWKPFNPLPANTSRADIAARLTKDQAEHGLQKRHSGLAWAIGEGVAASKTHEHVVTNDELVTIRAS